MEDSANLQTIAKQLNEHQKQLSSLKDVPKLLKEMMEFVKGPVQGTNPDASLKKPAVVSLTDTEDEEDMTHGGQEEDDDEFAALFDNQGDSFHNPDSAEVESILKDIEESVEYGLDLLPHVAEGFNKTVARPLKKETSEKLKQAIRVPGNCKGFVAPKMNPEMWRNLPAHARVTDLRIQHMQQSLSQGLITLANIANEIAAANLSQEIKSKVMKLSIDGANLLGDQFQSASQQRRMEVRKLLNSDYSSICTAQIPTSEFLFGDNLSETLKTSKAASGVLRVSFSRGNNRGHRFRPYAGKSNSNLNYQRPYPRQQQPYRGFQGQNRGRSGYSARGRYQNFLETRSTRQSPQ